MNKSNLPIIKNVFENAFSAREFLQKFCQTNRNLSSVEIENYFTYDGIRYYLTTNQWGNLHAQLTDQFSCRPKIDQISKMYTRQKVGVNKIYSKRLTICQEYLSSNEVILSGKTSGIVKAVHAVKQMFQSREEMLAKAIYYKLHKIVLDSFMKNEFKKDSYTLEIIKSMMQSHIGAAVIEEFLVMNEVVEKVRLLSIAKSTQLTDIFIFLFNHYKKNDFDITKMFSNTREFIRI
jgi:hypothetical protein